MEQRAQTREIPLRKKFHLDSIKSGHWYSNNLVVKNCYIRVDDDAKSKTLILDLSGNKSARNSSASEDYPSLVERRSELTSIEINDSSLTKSMLGQINLPGKHSWLVEIILGGNYSSLIYKPKIEISEQDGIEINLLETLT